MRRERARDRDTFYLSNAHQAGSLVRVTCGGCSPARVYVPEDLIKLFGDLAVIDLDDKMRCEGCGNPPSVRIYHPPAAERIGLIVRRLRAIKMVRKAVWREERL